MKFFPALGFFLLTCAPGLFGQKDSLLLNFSIKLTVGLGGSGSSFLHTSVAGGLAWRKPVGRFGFQPGVQFALNFYSRGIGANLHEARTKQGWMDFLSSIYTVGGYNGQPQSSRKFFKLGNQLTATTVFHDFDYSLLYGTNFVFNNHGRNQQFASLGLNFDKVIIGYYNDGFAPFNKVVADEFDRFWTGGGYVALGLNSWKLANRLDWHKDLYLEYAYDRFTWDAQFSYRIAKVLFIFGIPDKKEDNMFFNRALTSLALKDLQGSSAGFSMLGQCPCDIQDMLHHQLSHSRHLSFAPCRRMFTGSFQKNLFYQTSRL